MTDTANLALPCIEGGQAQKHVTHNEALRVLDTLVQLAVLDRDLTAPPGSPPEGQRWIVKTGATGAWAGHADAIAAWQDGAWQFSTPRAGWTAFVVDEGTLLVWNGTAWGDFFSTVTAIQNLAQLGIGTTADATDVLSAKLNNALFAARPVGDGGSGDLRYKLSKESASNTLSFLFQDNYSGRAEIGLTGDDDLHVKVSPDGSAWVEALLLNKTTGAATLAAGATAAAFVPSGSSLPANGVYLPSANTVGIAANATQIWTGTNATIAIKPTTVSASPTTGALTVAGGAGIAGNANIGGVLAVGGNSSGGVQAFLRGDATGGVSVYGVLTQQTIRSGVTSNYFGQRAIVTTEAAAFTLTNAYGYAAALASIGAGSAITNLYGFHAENNLVGAANCYGFFSNLPSGSGRWNFYAAGTAANYFAGIVQTGGAFLAPLTTPASSAAAGVAGTIEWDASYIYVCTAANTWKRAALSTF